MVVCVSKSKNYEGNLTIGCASWLRKHAVWFEKKNTGPWIGTEMTVVISFDREGGSVPTMWISKGHRIKDIAFQQKDTDFQELYNWLWDLEWRSVLLTTYRGPGGEGVANIRRLTYVSVKNVGDLGDYGFSKWPFSQGIYLAIISPLWKYIVNL